MKEEINWRSWLTSDNTTQHTTQHITHPKMSKRKISEDGKEKIHKKKISRIDKSEDEHFTFLSLTSFSSICVQIVQNHFHQYQHFFIKIHHKTISK
jgi:hypothetical protein